ncbi:hypothetical protein ACIP9H_02785 [Streptomyces sp. NPDC088732]|uniref:hypothetical protein n=1 Tax=Streptomyces sp. NPDC088732 TaxID=3365879 RepID=UPI00382C41A9
MGVVRAAGYIGVSAGPGTRVYFLPDDPRVPRTALDPVALARTLLSATGLIGRSPRRLVTGYFEHHGAPCRESEHQVVAGLPGGDAAEVDFDSLGRMAAVRVTARR